MRIGIDPQKYADFRRALGERVIENRIYTRWNNNIHYTNKRESPVRWTIQEIEANTGETAPNMKQISCN